MLCGNKLVKLDITINVTVIIYYDHPNEPKRQNINIFIILYINIINKLLGL